MAFNKYYQRELQNLRDLAREFSKVHPAIAPLLSGPTSDPDVERLLEGVAFLTGLLNQKLEDDFPQIIHGLMDVLFPNYLKPVPSTSLVIFTPKPSLMESVMVPAGTPLASIPVNGTKCLFRTCFDTEVHPLKLRSAELVQQINSPDCIRLELELNGLNLSQWNPQGLCFLLGGSYSQGTDLFLLLSRYLRQIIVQPSGEGDRCVLSPADISFPGFERQNSMLPLVSQSFSGYRVLQEYFILPHKFLFLELKGWEKWLNRGESGKFQIIFELEQGLVSPPKISRDHFQLFSTPVINLFSHQSDPVVLNPRIEKVLVRPAGASRNEFQIFSVDKVTAFVQGSATKKEYSPLERFADQGEDQSVYQVVRTQSPVDSSMETYLSFTFPTEGFEPREENLSISLTCTNGRLPERLQLGDISQQTSDSPGLLGFKNIIPPTPPLYPKLGHNTLWKLLSHLSLNFLSIANAGSLKDLLKLYIFPESTHREKATADLKRVEGILELKAEPVDRIVDGAIMRGQTIRMNARQDHFAGTGDLFLFGSVIDIFLGIYSSMNTFTRFQLTDTISGETFSWPVRIGDKPLI